MERYRGAYRHPFLRAMPEEPNEGLIPLIAPGGATPARWIHSWRATIERAA